jgi:hypothetical protein
MEYLRSKLKESNEPRQVATHLARIPAYSSPNYSACVHLDKLETVSLFNSFQISIKIPTSCQNKSNSMENPDQVTSSKILEVLCQISARLEDIDRRLQVSRPALPAEHRKRSPVLESRVLNRDYNSFRIRTCLDGVGRAHIEEIVFPPGRLLHLIQTLSCVCPRHPIAVNEVTYMFPFAEIMGQWEILRLIRGHTSPSAPGFLKTVCPKGEHEGLERDVGELLDCIEESANCGPSIKDRCARLDKGRVSFIHLPDIFAPGALISSNSNENGYQVAEVVSCDINSNSASGDVCEVLFWYFKWSGWVLVKHNGRFEVQQYSGTRKLKDLPFSPIATYSNPGETIEGYHASLGSSGKTLSFLKSLPSHEREFYPQFLHTQDLLGQSVRCSHNFFSPFSQLYLNISSSQC